MYARIAVLLAAVPLARAVPPPQEAVTIQPIARLVRIPPPGAIGPRVVVDAESQFLTTDPAVWYLLTYTGARESDKLHLEWRSPSGTVSQENDFTPQREGGQGRVVWKLPILGAPAASMPGEWHANLSVNGRSIASSEFTISKPPESAVNIANRLVLAQGTLGVPYFYQLVARGGTPPYRWSASKGLPAGLAVSPTGTITGKPERRGTFGVVVEARDAAGNSVTRTLGLPVGIAAASSIHADPRHLVRSATADACSEPSSVTEFSASDPSVVLATTLDAPAGREGRVEWLNPRGEVVQVNRLTRAAEHRECLVKTLSLAGRRAAELPGEWRVRLFWSDAEVFTLGFTVNAAPAATVAATARAGRLALLIDNRRYEKLADGQSAAGDLDVLANTLRQDGFEVIRVADANLEGLRQIEQTLDGKLQSGDTAFIYYAGYSARTAGDEWLLPVNFDPADTRPMQTRAYSAIRLLQWLEDSKAALRFVVLDSATPQGQPDESPGELLGEVDESTALVYSRSAAAGALARALAEVLEKPDADARTVLGIELPKAAGRGPAPMAILGGGADFVFRRAR
ncbi:MAG TPA: putative Ig domain-containing protein [Bryobacteraceae bacterium]|nr:putative Ig domain-containing protein [Bryobacteraceae bacterium]